MRAPPQVDPDPSPRIHACFANGDARLDGVCAAAEGHDTHDCRFVPSDELVRGHVAARRSRRAIEHIHCVESGVIPIADGRRCGHEGGTGELHY
eukprot:6212096-Pleurochrysis_carterae.AAC.5